MDQPPGIHWTLGHAAGPGLTARCFLHQQERRELGQLATPRRRRDWLLGRHTAKQLLQGYLWRAQQRRVPLAQLEIHRHPDGMPLVRGMEQRLSLSISHRQGWSLCALGPGAGVNVGADIELVEPRSARFVSDYFTAQELDQLRAAPIEQRDLLVTATWSAKEAALKALCLGLSVDTRRVCCELAPAGPGWSRYTVRHTISAPGPGRAPGLTGWWRPWQRFVLTLATTADTVGSPAAEPMERADTTLKLQRS